MKKVRSVLLSTLTLLALQACAPSPQELAEGEDTLGESPGGLALDSTAPVILETAGLKLYHKASGARVLVLTGVADLKNLSYQKSLTLHYSAAPFGTPDSSRTWTDASGTYRGPDANGYEQWTFESAEVPSDGSVNTDLAFALKYEVNGQTYWDNNSGKNYRLRWVQGYNMNQYDGAHGVLNNGPVVLNTANGTYTGTGQADVTFSVLVKNLGFQKVVNLVYTTDGWATTQTAPASYSSYVPFELEGLNLETWNVSLAGVPVSNVQFALSYQVNGITYWDNNLGMNYTWDLANGDLY